MIRKSTHYKLIQPLCLSSAKGGKEAEDRTLNTSEKSLEKILEKEEEATKQTVRQRGRKHIMQQKEEIKQRLEDLISDYEIKENELQQESAVFRDLKEKIDKIPENMAETEKRNYRQLLRTAELELNKHDEGDSSVQSITPQTSTITEATFFQLTRAGIALTWPLILTILGAMSFLGLLIYSVFAV